MFCKRWPAGLRWKKNPPPPPPKRSGQLQLVFFKNQARKYVQFFQEGGRNVVFLPKSPREKQSEVDASNSLLIHKRADMRPLKPRQEGDT